MRRGYVKLWRKSLDAGWIRNHKLWCFWTYCLLKATHKEFDAIVGLQLIHLYPGQFIFGLRKASVETGLSVQEIGDVKLLVEASVGSPSVFLPVVTPPLTPYPARFRSFLSAWQSLHTL